MRASAAVLALVTACAAHGWPAGAHLVPYPVEGKFTEDVTRAIEAQGPLVDGVHEAASTVFVFVPRPHFAASFAQGADRCTCTQTVDEFEIDLHLGTSLPQWRDYGGALAACQKAWDSYQRDLRRHEVGHVRIAQEHQRLWRQHLVGLRRTADAADCTHACSAALDGLLTDMDSRSEAEAEAHRQAQQAYDGSHPDPRLAGCARILPGRKTGDDKTTGLPSGDQATPGEGR